MIEIREAEAGDAERLAEWLADPETSVYFPMADPKEIYDAAKRWVELAMEQKCGWIALYHRAPVGFGIVFLQDYVRLKHQAMHMLLVDASYRQLGVGAQLLNTVMEKGRQRGVELLHVEVYDDTAIERFYKKHGFVEFARQQRWTCDNGVYRSRVCLERFL